MKYSILKITACLLVLFFFSGFVSCTKRSEDSADNMVKEADLEIVNTTDLNETDEDLLNVDYREFYDELAPHGEWIEVSDEEIGVELNKGTSSGKSHRSISFNDLFGVKEAHAFDVSFGAFFVWKPAPNLAVGIVAGEPVAYTPYTNGQWIYSSSGWYFRAASPHEEITHHYGRWVYSPTMGWLWVPGRVWAPAWVDWREHEEYIAWTPVPPGIYIVNNYLIAPPVYEERYVVIERRYFVEPEIYRYSYKVHNHKHKFKIKEWRRMDGIMVVNNTVINRGPDVTVIQSITGRTFDPVIINHTAGGNKISYSDKEYRVHTPEFKKVKKDVKYKGPVSKPNEFTNFKSASKKETGSNDNYRPDNDKKEQDRSKNDNKNRENPEIDRKYIDDKDMKNGKNNQNDRNKNDGSYKRKNDQGKNDQGKNNSKQKDNIKENKGNDNNSKGKDRKNDGNSPGKEKGKKFKNDSYKDKNNNDGVKYDNKQNGEQNRDNSKKNKGRK
ncbi:MAG: Membrane protein involved in colicin uptake-like protein [Chlorobi bacterium OLB5]|nr:MAG: Membrane protein involved in colicin uptake-like protein [Chlorobi bacterium OLB5]